MASMAAFSRFAGSSLRNDQHSFNASLLIGWQLLNGYSIRSYTSTYQTVNERNQAKDTEVSKNSLLHSIFNQANPHMTGSKFSSRTPRYRFSSVANAVAAMEDIQIDHVSSGDDEDHHQLPPALGPTKPGEKPRIVVLGSGWGGCRFLKGVNTEIYDVVCVSPRNHMVFTPLLASTCVGTLEFRSVAEPVSQIQSALAKAPNSYFLLAKCTGLDADKHEVYCETVKGNEQLGGPKKFRVAYDKLIIASGAEPMTFNIKGVKENAIFLREVHHAREIRKKLHLNLMLCESPALSAEKKRRILHCVIVGGGPTGIEFSGELSDFIVRDVQERYAHAKDYISISLIEANEILSSFDPGLRQYAIKHLTKCGVRLVRGVVQEVQSKKIKLRDGTELPYGLLVWSTGVGPSEFVKSIDFPKSTGGRIGVDEWLRVPPVEDVFALGDCAGFLEQTGRPVLPALAQVAEREGKYLAELLNKVGEQKGGKAFSAKGVALGEPFVYKHIGSMASVGRYKALVDLRESKTFLALIPLIGLTAACRMPTASPLRDSPAGSFGALPTWHVSSAGGIDSMWPSTGRPHWFSGETTQRFKKSISFTKGSHTRSSSSETQSRNDGR